MTWKRYCDTNSCVEAQDDGWTVSVRNSCNPAVAVHFTRAEWDDFIAAIRAPVEAELAAAVWVPRTELPLADAVDAYDQVTPRLTWARETRDIAIDRQSRHVLTTGLGVLGVGTMWIKYVDELPEWANLPERDSTGGFGAEAVGDGG